MSKPSSDLPDARRALLEQLAQLGDVLGREEGRDPAVGDLAGERGVLGADRREVDRDPLLYGGDHQLQRLAGTVRQRQLERLALELDALARERHAHHGDVLARALKLAAEALPVPALGDLRARGADAAASCVRRRAGRSSPRSSPSSPRERPGIWKIAEPRRILLVCPASQASTVAASEP